MDIENYRRFFQYDHWANLEVIHSLKDENHISARSLALLAHILGAEYVWLSRLKQEPSTLPVWPQLTLLECEQHILALKEIWVDFLNRIGSNGLNASVSYKNTKGEVFASSVLDILMHVVMHSAYHRGQIAMDMRANGYAPAYTDFIHAVRQRKLN